jgi:glycosyltransferase involved in cell wall biosynthesis
MNTRSKTLIILSPGFPKDEQDTACLPAQQVFIRALNRNFPNLQIMILSFEYPFTKSNYRWHGNEVFAFGGRNRRKIARFRMWRSVWKRLHTISENENIIGLLSFWCTETALLGKRFAKKNKLKHFCWIMGQDARKGNGMIPLIRPEPAELIALSDSAAREFFNNYGVQPSRVIPPGIEPIPFWTDPPGRIIDLLGAGALIPLKQYDLFVKIVHKIKEKIPAVNAMLCGKGPEEEKLNQSIESLQLTRNLYMTGELPHAEVLRLMQKTKVFLHPSAYEGFGMVCVEALNAGARVISFCKPMNDQIENWHIVQDEKEMAERAIDLLAQDSSRFSPVLYFSSDDCAKKIISLFADPG